MAPQLERTMPKGLVKTTAVLTAVSFLVLTNLVMALQSQDESKRDTKNYMLPRHAVPKNYTVQLHPNFSNITFSGKVTILIEVLNSTGKITLHAKNITIQHIFLTKDNKEIKIKSYDFSNDDREFLNVNFDDISTGLYNLSINYEGLHQGIKGFYKSKLKNGSTMVASKFQPTYARRAFPCFDEPEYKASFDITIVTPKKLIALSNMNEISKDPGEDADTNLVHFAMSAPMSTYLACFVICDFAHKEDVIDTQGIGKSFVLRSFAQKDNINQIDFAQDIGKRATEYFIQYYNVPFPLPKLDMIAIPDYQSGATEHWGLITYKELSFLVDEATASVYNKYSVANTICHELAHMWFGNLVTLKWWNDLWLNEGFATYMQAKSLHNIHPTWTVMDRFLVQNMHRVMVTDAKLSSHPIVQSVETPDEITAMFDIISYSKAASIIRMWEGFMGEENFRRGLTDYLKKFQFGITVTADLMACMEPYFKQTYPNLSLNFILDTWTRQMGYPVLNVTLGGSENKTYIIQQRRFFLNPTSTTPKDSPFDYRWFVPITYKSNKRDATKLVWLPNTAQKVEITLGESEKWLKLNNDQIGYYRVNYPTEVWQTLIQELKHKSIQLTISDRANLLDDVFALAEGEIVNYSLAMDVATYLRMEDSLVPWETAAHILKNLDRKLIDTPAQNDLKKFVHYLLKPLYVTFNWVTKNEGVMERMLRTTILSLATRFDMPEASAKAREMMQAYLGTAKTKYVKNIDVDLRDFIYYEGMKAGAMSDWDKLWAIYLLAEDAQELNKFLLALAAPRDAAILARYLELAWDENLVRRQNYYNVLQYIAANPVGAPLVWDYVRNHWPEIVERFSLNDRYLGNTIPAITADFNTPERLAEMEEFFAKYPEAGAGEVPRRRALENVKNNIIWQETHVTAISTWLQNYVQQLGFAKQ